VLLLLGAVGLDDVTDSFIGWNAGDPCNASSLFSAGRIRRQAESPDGGRRSGASDSIGSSAGLASDAAELDIYGS
jgi:hypothetical protein